MGVGTPRQEQGIWIFLVVFHVVGSAARHHATVAGSIAQTAHHHDRARAQVACHPARASAGNDEFLGFPVFRYIDINDSEEVLRAIHLTDPEIPLDTILHTPGGPSLAATQIARAVFKHKGKVTVFVPHYAMSGGTLIALAVDELYHVRTFSARAGRPATGRYPAASILQAVHRKPIAEVETRR
jgi:hypothetical protein